MSEKIPNILSPLTSEKSMHTEKLPGLQGYRTIRYTDWPYSTTFGKDPDTRNDASQEDK